MRVTNYGDVEATVHWHGLGLENRYDGVPQETQAPIQRGETFTYRIQFPDPGLYWYTSRTTPQPREQIGTLGVPGEDLRLIATLAQHPVDPLDALAFVARRICGVEADKSLEQLYRTLVERDFFVRR